MSRGNVRTPRPHVLESGSARFAAQGGTQPRVPGSVLFAEPGLLPGQCPGCGRLQ